jgi:hypothetical protein
MISSNGRSRSNHAMRSSSGKVCIRPDRGGHSISKVLLDGVAGSRSALDQRGAQARTILPPDWRISPRSTNSDAGTGAPISSVELAAGRLERILAGLVLALRDRPRTGVLARPVRPAHVAEQHLDHATALPSPVQQDSGTPSHPPEDCSRGSDPDGNPTRQHDAGLLGAGGAVDGGLEAPLVGVVGVAQDLGDPAGRAVVRNSSPERAPGSVRISSCSAQYGCIASISVSPDGQSSRSASATISS